MSEENVDAFKRGVSAMNAGNVDRLLDVVHPDVVWRDAINALVGGEATIYRGYGGVRQVFRDLFESVAGIDADYYDVRDLGDERVLGLGQLRMRVARSPGSRPNLPSLRSPNGGTARRFAS